jgi:hypothetical protein
MAIRRTGADAGPEAAGLTFARASLQINRMNVKPQRPTRVLLWPGSLWF